MTANLCRCSSPLATLFRLKSSSTGRPTRVNASVSATAAAAVAPPRTDFREPCDNEKINIPSTRQRASGHTLRSSLYEKWETTAAAPATTTTTDDAGNNSRCSAIRKVSNIISLCRTILITMKIIATGNTGDSYMTRKGSLYISALRNILLTKERREEER